MLKHHEGNEMDYLSIAPALEQEFEAQIKLEAEHIPIPEGLQPEQILLRLEEEQFRLKAEQLKKRKRYNQFAAVASLVFVVGLASILGSRVFFIPTQMVQDLGSQEPAAISSMDQATGAAQLEVGEYEEISAEVASARGNVFGFAFDPYISNETTIARASYAAEIFSLLEAYQRMAYAFTNPDLGIVMPDLPAGDPNAPASPSRVPSLVGGESFDQLTTNERNQDVGEGDIVKTDGSYLYILDNNEVKIVDVREERMRHVYSLKMQTDQFINEIYVSDVYLIIVYSSFDIGASDMAERRVVNWGNHTTYTAVYDISNPSKPVDLGARSQSGQFYSMRVIDGYLYTLSTFNPSLDSGLEATESFVPSVNQNVMDLNQILLPQYQFANEYTVITSTRLNHPTQVIDRIAILGASGMNYISQNHMFFTEMIYHSEYSGKTETCIRMIHFDQGKFTPIAQNRVLGHINDSFSIDEYNGYLRLLTTISPNGLRHVEDDAKAVSALYILDSNLAVVGSIEDIAENELVFSARFVGDVGYFVTFRQDEPMFSVDLSDPHNPSFIGDLDIPSFSRYLHPYMSGLLGIGVDLDDTGSIKQGVKLSMFDISDPSSVMERHTYVIPNTWGSNVEYNYRAALINETMNLIGFTSFGDHATYHIFSYSDQSGFEQVFERRLPGHNETRGIYIGERFFLISGNTIEVFRISDFYKLGDIVL